MKSTAWQLYNILTKRVKSKLEGLGKPLYLGLRCFCKCNRHSLHIAKGEFGVGWGNNTGLLWRTVVRFTKDNFLSSGKNFCFAWGRGTNSPHHCCPLSNPRESLDTHEQIFKGDKAGHSESPRSFPELQSCDFYPNICQPSCGGRLAVSPFFVENTGVMQSPVLNRTVGGVHIFPWLAYLSVFYLILFPL